MILPSPEKLQIIVDNISKFHQMRISSRILLFTFFLLTTAIQAQKTDILIDFGDEQISKDKFKSIYIKNNSGEIVQKSTVEEYLELYINFKLKVREALARGLDTVGSFKKELAGYRQQLAQPYLSEQAIIEELKKEAYERLKQDVRVSHILIKVEKDASPSDTLRAYKRAEELRKELLKGADFEELARKHSDDPSVNINGGDLGYFTAFQMVYPFESEAYKTQVGKISSIVRSRYGYHIVKVNDKRPSMGKLTIAHILISTDPQLSKTDDPKGKINEIYKKLKEGTAFEELASQFSDDARSAKRGGQLPEFGPGKMVPEIESEAIKLKNPGDYSKPIKTDYGWHIIRKIDQKKIGPYEKMDQFLEDKVKKDSRSKLSEGAVMKKIKKQYGFKENLKYRDTFYDFIDSTYFENEWNGDHLFAYNHTLFTIGDDNITQKDFARYLNTTQSEREPIDIIILVNNKYRAFKRKTILAYKDSRLDEEYPEFKSLMQEYHDGILLFNLTEKLVWSRAVNDTLGVKDFYEKNKQNYKWKERLDAIYFSALNEEIASRVRQMIKDSIGIDQILEEINRPSQLNLKYEHGIYERGDNELIDSIVWKKGTSENMNFNGRIAFVLVNKVLAPSYKTLEDSRGIITSDYQQFLEDEWINELRTKYTYKINKSILSALQKELN